MLNANEFVEALAAQGMEFFAGVPDSLLKPLLAYIQDHARPEQHVLCANEGNAVALAAGYHLGTRKLPVVYMQNSGLGNAVNPLTSLADPQVYAIPMLLLIGWRGEPNVKDEPQHIKQGAITPRMLEVLGVDHEVLSPEPEEARAQVRAMGERIQRLSKPCAFLIRDNTFNGYPLVRKSQPLSELPRERAIQRVLEHASRDPRSVVLSTTGKISREVYETRTTRGERADDFLNVGSMGHIGSIALGLALTRPDKRVLCLDGDGSLLMHMGSMAILGQSGVRNLVHIVLNNSAHESVGGQPTVAGRIDLLRIGAATGYKHCLLAEDEAQLEARLAELEALSGPVLLEIRVALGSRADLGRPRSTPLENKLAFMDRLHG